MQAIAANEAKTQLGDLLLKVQREPVQINENGKPVAVVVSTQEYEAIETMKAEVLRQRFSQAEAQVAAGDVVDGDTFMNDLLES